MLDALTDAAEALQMADLKAHAPDAILLDDQVRTGDDDLTHSHCIAGGDEGKLCLRACDRNSKFHALKATLQDEV